MSSSDRFIQVAVPRPLDRFFTYRLSDESFEEATEGRLRGRAVRVPFGRSKSYGFIVDEPFDLSSGEQKKIGTIKTADLVGGAAARVQDEIYELCQWASRYYQAPLGEVLQAAAPFSALGLKTKGKVRDIKRSQADLEAPAIQLTSEQTTARDLLLELYDQKQHRVALLDGVTGSGKTEVYIELAKRALADGGGVLFLVPEIALTPQLFQRLERALGVPLVAWHSALADGVRRDAYQALVSGKVRVVVGARSAVFAPLQNLRLTVVDEEHDATFKQEDRVRYNGRDLAIVRAKRSGSLIVLGSATPSLESLENVRKGQYSFTQLKSRPKAVTMPDFEIVDLREERLEKRLQAPFSERTLEAIQETIDQGKQAMVFLNRRGFAAALICKGCGQDWSCPDCSVSLTVHKKERAIRCHSCGFKQAQPLICPHCKSTDLERVGAGTESLEDQLPLCLRGMKGLRLDRDQITSNTRLEELLHDFREGKANVLLGTQMLVKGHDFPNVTLVVVVLADALFRWPEFRANERAYQILTQVAGRAGRAEHPGRVLIQTYVPEHEVLQVVTGMQSRDEFLEREREARQALNYPPFGRLLKVRLEHRESHEAKTRANFLAHALRNQYKGGELDVLGPSDAFVERLKGQYRQDLLIKSKDPGLLHQAAQAVRAHSQNHQWQSVVDIDPYAMI